ncbi:MAG: YdcF family protein [Hyphomicrobiales bacterium]|nr:YdcF family protein [Hyphomicrobiales bacterium]
MSEAPDSTQEKPKQRGWLRRLAVGALAFALFVVVFFFAGFLRFTLEVARIEPPDAPQADAIVALTGGTARVDAALRLLSDGRAERLLISGVHPRTTGSAIGRRTDADRALLKCCVDLDHRAADTIGNAVETGKWLQSRGYRSLIVVTSNYHMPRSLMELGNALPDVDLIAYPVRVDTVAVDRWWLNPGTARLLAQEYLKYIVAGIRVGLDRGPGARLAAAATGSGL